MRVSSVALVHGNSVLLAKRCELWNDQPIPFGGYWSTFSGSIEKNESPMHCAIRELEEESQLKFNIEDLKFVKIIYEKDVTIHFYVIELEDIVFPILNAEHTEYGWFFIDDLDGFVGDIDKNYVECIKKYKRNRFMP